MDIINPYIHGGEALTFDGFGNRSRSFDGVDNYASIPDFEHSLTNLSCMCWIKSTDSTYKSFFSHWDNNSNRSWLIQLDGTNGLLCAVKGTAASSYKIYFAPDAQDTIADGTWHHIGFTFSNNDLRLYIDGLRVPDVRVNKSFGNAVITSIKNSTANILIGADIASSLPANFVDSRIADCRIYNATLTEAEISDIYNGTNITTNLAGHWLTDADNVLDAAGTNHGTNIGSKYSYDNPSPPVEFGSASRSFDGVNDSIDLGNSVKFGDGSNDNPFSVSAWIKMNDATKFRILGDWHDFGAVNSAFTFTTSGTNTFYLYLKDSSNNGVRARGYNFDMTSYEGEWIHVSATYNGVGGTNADQGIKLYLNGLRVDDESLIVGSYVAMEATTNNLEIGSVEIATGRDYADGKIADVRIYDTDLTASQISDLYAGTDVQTNLVGHWLTDNDDVEDKAGTNDGTNFGSTYSIDNPPLPLVPSRQASRDFDGTSDRVTIPANIFNGATTLTVSAWIKLDSLSINQTVIGRLDNNDGFRLMVRDTNQIDLIWGVGNSNFVSTLDGATLGSGSWIHVAGTFNNSGNATRYVDGAQTGTIDDLSSYGSLSILGDVGIGARVQTTSPLYNLPLGGKIADVRIYDAELTASQILDIYNGTTDRTNLVGQWLTNSDDVLDHAGTRDGTNFGSTYSADSPS